MHAGRDHGQITDCDRLRGLVVLEFNQRRIVARDFLNHALLLRTFDQNADAFQKPNGPFFGNCPVLVVVLPLQLQRRF